MITQMFADIPSMMKGVWPLPIATCTIAFAILWLGFCILAQRDVRGGSNSIRFLGLLCLCMLAAFCIAICDKDGFEPRWKELGQGYRWILFTAPMTLWFVGLLLTLLPGTVSDLGRFESKKTKLLLRQNRLSLVVECILANAFPLISGYFEAFGLTRVERNVCEFLLLLLFGLCLLAHATTLLFIEDWKSVPKSGEVQAPTNNLQPA